MHIPLSELGRPFHELVELFQGKIHHFLYQLVSEILEFRIEKSRRKFLVDSEISISGVDTVARWSRGMISA